MSDDRDPMDDDVLLRALGDVLDADEPFPAPLRDVEAAAFASRRLDDELAELLYDTAAEPAGVRGDDGPRTLSFAAGDHVIDVELHDDGLVGQISPPDAVLLLDGPDGEAALEPDRLGRFTAVAPIGRLRFVIGAASRRIVTPWVFR
jgi:hypothetical protein